MSESPETRRPVDRGEGYIIDPLSIYIGRDVSKPPEMEKMSKLHNQRWWIGGEEVGKFGAVEW